MNIGPLELLIFQGTSFCNIDCKYCYLPNRASTKQISLETVVITLKKIFDFEIVKKDFSIVWHAGEPLAMPLSFYENASELISSANKSEFKIGQTLQTNGILLNQEWCSLIKRNGINVGISLDGPDFIHDRQRVDRKGKATHYKVMDGVRLLKKNKIPFYVIAVITEFSLDYADDFFYFFLKNGITRLCFNIEEAEGVNSISSLTKDSLKVKFEQFILRLYELYDQHRHQISIREFEQLEHLILKGKLKGNLSQQTVPFRIINVDVEGNFSTFSPELLGMNGGKYENFHLGNFNIDSLSDALKSPKLDDIYSEILSGILKCKISCRYFNVCGGGAPSNKFSENGTFDSTETVFCRLKHQTMFDLVLKEIEQCRTV